MRKMSKAQERELQRMRERYTNKLEKERTLYAAALETAIQQNDKIKIKWNKEHLEMAEKGFVLWISSNSRTLEILQELGYIEYVKKDTNRNLPIDYIKLLEV